MTVQSCKFINAKNTQFDSRNRMTATAVFRIIDDTPGRSRRTIMDEALTASPDNFPSLWKPWSWLSDTDNTTFATTFSIDLEDEDKSNLIYIAEVGYRPAAPGETILFDGGGASTGNNATDPLSRPLRWGTPSLHVEVRVLEKDQTGKAILNSAGKPFDPGLEVQVAFPVRTAFYNYADEDTALAASLNMLDAVNDTTWRGNAERTVWCKVAQVLPEVDEQGNTYTPVKFDFVYQRDGEKWDAEILNRDHGYLKEAEVLSSFQPTDDEKVLASDGTIDTSGNGSYSTFRHRVEKDFANVLGF